ncbi:MAG: hypothetical protein JO182_08300 [Acidobacteriaceae bacterium]|nr:hypothetical protein [Acidobacteriaceae bacterium]MBV9034480.1 hypothetical protein [Acidobacteriaceae bacterium]MBV9938959.1 hypothetical protein [Acidobacteriaceae bacterium]
MFGSEVLDVAIGLILIFLLLSLICSSIREAFETVLRHRSSDLERGLREMFGDKTHTGLVADFYRHPLIEALFRGDYVPGKTRNLPSYIPTRTFSLTIINLLVSKYLPQADITGKETTESDKFEYFSQAVANMPEGSRLKGAMEPLIAAANQDFTRLRAEIEQWFNSSMDRVSGWYKTRTQIIIAAIGLSLAAIMNVDSLAIVRYLDTNQTARSVLISRVAQVRSESDAKPSTSELIDPMGWIERQGGLPLGWVLQVQPGQQKGDFEHDWRRPPSTFSGWLAKLAGILFTAFALTLGAPFWFDLLNRFMVVRSTVKPEEKSPPEPSKDAGGK